MKKEYVKPEVNIIEVEVEQNFCGSLANKPIKPHKIRTRGHEIGKEINAETWKPNDWK